MSQIGFPLLVVLLSWLALWVADASACEYRGRRRGHRWVRAFRAKTPFQRALAWLQAERMTGSVYRGCLTCSGYTVSLLTVCSLIPVVIISLIWWLTGLEDKAAALYVWWGLACLLMALLINLTQALDGWIAGRFPPKRESAPSRRRVWLCLPAVLLVAVGIGMASPLFNWEKLPEDRRLTITGTVSVATLPTTDNNAYALTLEEYPEIVFTVPGTLSRAVDDALFAQLPGEQTTVTVDAQAFENDSSALDTYAILKVMPFDDRVVQEQERLVPGVIGLIVCLYAALLLFSAATESLVALEPLMVGDAAAAPQDEDN